MRSSRIPTSTIITILFFISNVSVFFQNGYAQSDMPAKGVVTGGIADEFGKPVSYVSIFVLDADDSLTLAYGMTDDGGKFTISGLPYKKFFLKIEHVGYSTIYTIPFVINSGHPVYKLQKIKLTERVHALGGVEIKAQVGMLESNLDKKVFNVESSITTDGATAVEVLEEIPSVDVDLDGNVTFRGSENVTVLVDGRSTHLTLDQIPANLIESIEVITNPSARLEPDGMSGILNVVLKKRRESGFNGMVSGRGSMGIFRNKPVINNYSGNLNFNYNYNKINLFLNYNFRGNHRLNGGQTHRISWFGEIPDYLYQNNDSESGGYSHNVRTGLDWFINTRNTLSLTISYNHNRRQSENKLTVQNDSLNEFLYNSGNYYTDILTPVVEQDWLDAHSFPREEYVQTNRFRNIRHNLSASLNYKKTFEKKGRELTADLYYTRNHREPTDTTAQNYSLPVNRPSLFQKAVTIDDNTKAAGRVDFITPVGMKGRIETGYKLSFRSVGEDYRFFRGDDTTAMYRDNTQSNHFVYTEIINALYFIYSTSFWEKLKIQVGLRGEIARTRSDLKSANEIHNKNYYNLFPTAHIRYDITPEHALQISYSRRVSRPNIWQLNPFVDVSDKLNHRKGNPELTPEFVHSMELGYLMTVRKSVLNFTVFYRRRNDIISRYTELYRDEKEGDNYTLTSYRNLDKSRNFGFEVVFGQKLWNFWNISLSGSFYRVIIDDDSTHIDDYLARDRTWSARLNQSFNLPGEWQIQLNFRYRAPSITTGSMGWGSGGVGQGKRSGNYSLDLGIKKSFLNKSLVISLNCRNLISSYKTKIITYMHQTDRGYDSFSLRERNRFNISLSISYKINNYKKRNIKNNDNDYPEDQDE